MDQFLDSKWGKRFLSVIGGVIVTAAGAIYSFIASLGLALKYGLLGACVALLVVAILMLFTTAPEQPTPKATLARPIEKAVLQWVEKELHDKILEGLATAESPESILNREVRGRPLDSSINMLVSIGPENTKDVDLADFTTKGRAAVEISTERTPSALRFTTPVERTIRKSDLPAEVPVGSGRLIIKHFTEKGFAFEEQNTTGDQVRAEIYFDSTLESLALKARQIIANQRQRFTDAVKRFSLQGRRISIRSAKPDSETADYCRSLIELFESNGMPVGDQITERSEYDPSGLVLVVRDTKSSSLAGHARTISDLLTEARIDFVLGSDGILRGTDDWCYLHVGRRVELENGSSN